MTDDLQDLNLLGATEPAPVQIYNADGSAPHLVVCDHAACLVPATLNNLGLTEDQLSQHIGWDPGALDIAKYIANALDAPLIHSCYSRLVCDFNRYQFDPNAIPERSDGLLIPGNANLSASARFRRYQEVFRPYHDAIAARLDEFEAAGVHPTFLSIHTCTDSLNGVFRPWPISLSYAQDTRISQSLIAHLRQREVCEVGDNEPYSLDIGEDFTVCEHAMRRGLAHMQVEFRQDLIGTEQDAQLWAAKFLPSLQQVLDEPGLHERQIHAFPDFLA